LAVSAAEACADNGLRLAQLSPKTHASLLQLYLRRARVCAIPSTSVSPLRWRLEFTSRVSKP
jgi:hypothetical protein